MLALCILWTKAARGGHPGNICRVPTKQALAAFEPMYLKNELDFTADRLSDSFSLGAFTQQEEGGKKMDAKFIC